MAEIKIQKKKSSNAGLWIFIIILLIIATILILDATEVISTPDWIHSSVNADTLSPHNNY